MKVQPQTYHDTYSSAVTSVYQHLEEKGYTINGDDWFREVTLGGKPKVGETKTSMGIGLELNGKTLKKCLHIQVYRIQMPDYTNDRFELNWYIS
jgi:hypothetical protein